MKDNKEKPNDDHLRDVAAKDQHKDLMYLQDTGKKLFPDLATVPLSEFFEFIPSELHADILARIMAR